MANELFEKAKDWTNDKLGDVSIGGVSVGDLGHLINDNLGEIINNVGSFVDGGIDATTRVVGDRLHYASNAVGNGLNAAGNFLGDNIMGNALNRAGNWLGRDRRTRVG